MNINYISDAHIHELVFHIDKRYPISNYTRKKWNQFKLLCENDKNISDKMKQFCKLNCSYNCSYNCYDNCYDIVFTQINNDNYNEYTYNKYTYNKYTYNDLDNLIDEFIKKANFYIELDIVIGYIRLKKLDKS
jgi:hypothetical protein